MVKVSKQSPKATRKRRGAGIVGSIAPIELPDTGMKTNIYGRSGTGKTTLACTWPKPLLLMGAEDGRRSVYDIKGVDYVRMTDAAHLRELIEHQRTTQKYKTLVLDAATSYQDLVLLSILGEIPAQLDWGVVSREQWGQASLIMKEQLRDLLSLEDTCHLVILAQEREFNSEESSELLVPSVMSGVSPAVAAWLCFQCDYVYQTFTIQERVKTKVKTSSGKTIPKTQTRISWCLRTRPHPVYMAKMRLRKGLEVPEYIVDPNYTKLSKLIDGR